jgi:nucleoside-diphosphate-sugar epimerase
MSNDKTAVPSFTDKFVLGEAERGDRIRCVVVTGGSGKLGRATVKYLSDEG